MANANQQTENTEQYTHTVHCFDDKSKRQHCQSLTEAVQYANELLSQGHKYHYVPD